MFGAKLVGIKQKKALLVMIDAAEVENFSGSIKDEYKQYNSAELLVHPFDFMQGCGCENFSS